jgi:uncharacterized peroxidase-related enzyme
MARIPTIDPKTATGEAKALLDGVQAALGAAPNFTRVLANSPKALEGFLGLYGATAKFGLDKQTQERIALAVAEANACQYCVSAHTAIGRRAGLSNAEMLASRQGTADNAKAAAVVALARALNDNRGTVSDAQFAAARNAGLTDADIIETIALVVVNFFTNLIGKATQIDIDFPEVELLDLADRAA